MKYIKLYESFETDIEDILLEINDIGYETHINEINKANFLTIMNADADHSKPIEKRLINFNDIKDCVLRLKDYLGDKYLMSQVGYRLGKQGYSKIDLNENTEIGEDVFVFYMCWSTDELKKNESNKLNKKHI